MPRYRDEAKLAGVVMADQNTGSEREGVAATDAFGPTDRPEAGEPDAHAVIEALNAENASLKDKVLRGLADLENMRRRSEREAADARTYGVTSFARDMLTVADNLRRALDSVPQEARATADGSLKALIEGLELTERDFLATLGRFGVRKLEPLGQKFDPNMHQAMYELPDDSVPSGTVKQIMQPGYAIGERVLRPALVGVSKGGPRVAANAQANAGGGEGK
jgi:molecular chaperone GrpE